MALGPFETSLDEQYGFPTCRECGHNFALSLEYLQASFYTEAEQSGALSGKTAQAAKVVGATERAHVKAFQKLLGAKVADVRTANAFGKITHGEV